MDLKYIEVKDQATMDIKHPLTGELLLDEKENPMTITVYGSETATYKKRIFELRRKMVEKQDTTFEGSEDFAMEMLVAVTANWSILLDGNHPTCAQKAVRELYAAQPWIRDQVDTFVHEKRNFLSVASGD
jgi:hypothetical protein